MAVEETIAMLKTLKYQALKSNDNTVVLEVKLDSFNFVLDEAIKALEVVQQAPKMDLNEMRNEITMLIHFNRENVIEIIDKYRQ